MNRQANKQTNNQTNKQTNKPNTWTASMPIYKKNLTVQISSRGTLLCNLKVKKFISTLLI